MTHLAPLNCIASPGGEVRRKRADGSIPLMRLSGLAERETQVSRVQPDKPRRKAALRARC
jgi:hypothetical protein